MPKAQATSDSATEPDPIFAAIAKHRTVYLDYLAAMKRGDAKPKAPQALTNATAGASEVEAAAMAELLETGPSTLAGARAFVQHLANVEDGCLPQETRDLVTCLVRSPLFAAADRVLVAS